MVYVHVCDLRGYVAQVYVIQVTYVILSGPGVKDRPRDSWRTVVHKELSTLKVGLKWYKLAQNRQAWRQLIATVRT